MRENQFRRKKRANTIPLQIQIWILVYRSIASGAPLKNNTRFPRLVITLLFAYYCIIRTLFYDS